MARHESDREDILREATALVERVEFARSVNSAGEPPVVVGFRANGAASFYLSPDFVLHFNPHGELRRAYNNGQLLKATGGQLITMDRHRGAEKTVLVSRELNATESGEFCQRASLDLQRLYEQLNTGQLKVTQQVPEQSDVRRRVLEWLRQFGGILRIAIRPHVDG